MWALEISDSLSNKCRSSCNKPYINSLAAVSSAFLETNALQERRHIK